MTEEEPGGVGMSDSSHGNPIGVSDDDEARPSPPASPRTRRGDVNRAPKAGGAAEENSSAKPEADASSSAPTAEPESSSSSSSSSAGGETPPGSPASERGGKGDGGASAASEEPPGNDDAASMEKRAEPELEPTEAKKARDAAEAKDDGVPEEPAVAEGGSAAQEPEPKPMLPARSPARRAKSDVTSSLTSAAKAKGKPQQPQFVNFFGPAVGSVLGEYPCRHREPPRAYAYQGRLYAATRAVCFYSANFFGFEQCRIVLPWRAVTGLAKSKDDEIVVEGNKDGDLLFRGFKDRDAVFDVLHSLWEKDALGGERANEGSDGGRGGGAIGESPARSVVISDCPVTGHTESGSISVQESMALRRSAKLGDKEAAAAEAAEEAAEAEEGTPSASAHSEPARGAEEAGAGEERASAHSAPDLGGAPAPRDGGGEEREEATDEGRAAAAAAAVCATSDARKSQRILISEMVRGGLLSPEGQAAAKKYGKMAPEDMAAAWRGARDATEPSFANVVVERAALPCTLDEFFDLFLSNESRHSIADFQRDVVGDTQLETSPWKLSEHDAFSLTRTVRYVHPVNAPMAPPSAAATKEQCYRRYGDEGLVLETQTVVNDVPMADCFFVDDRLLVEPTPEGGVELTAAFEVRFVRRTMFRKVISGTSGKEVSEGLRGYETYVRKALEERAAEQAKETLAEAEAQIAAKEREAPPMAAAEGEGEVAPLPTAAPIAAEVPATAASPPAAPPSSARTETYLLLLAGLVGALVLLQCASVWQARSVGRSLDRLNDAQERLAYLMGEILAARGGEVRTCAAEA